MIHKVKPDFDSSAIQTIGVVPQFEKLDILIKVNEAEANKLAILVEDKTHTSNHSNQLDRYYELVEKAGYDKGQMVPLYFKTGYQSRFDTLGEFRTYLRKDFLTVLQNGKRNGVANAIYDDFLAHLQQIDALIQQFSTKPASKWGYHDWVGFFTVLYDQRSVLSSSTEDDGANWGYVANPSGGFVGYWWYFKQLADKGFAPYIQLEEDILCFKIMVDDDLKRQSARDEAHHVIMKSASQVGLTASRPDRMGNGKYMTVARIKDYRVSTPDGCLDMVTTLENLKKAQEILDLAFPNQQPAES